MDRKKKLFNDILVAISFVDEFLGPIDLFEEYVADLKTKSAIERQLSIIGEAVKLIKEIDNTELIKFYQDIIGFRIILVHKYDKVDDRIVWKIIKEDLPPLKKEVEEKLITED